MLRTDDETIRTLLERTRTIAMIGASDNPGRPSHGVMAFLQGRGYRVVPVNPTLSGKTILDEKVYPGLADIAASFEMVDIFSRADKAGEAVDAAISAMSEKGIRAVWMQLGVIDNAAAARARAAGLEVVMDRCPAIEIRRLYGQRSPLQAGHQPDKISS